jgi:HEPN domain-containing protein
LPATVETGERAVAVSVLFRDRALSAVTETATVQIEQRATTLSLSTTAVEERILRVRGRLSVAGGGGLADRLVSLDASDRLVTELETGDDGRFNATVVVPPSAIDDGQATIGVRFESGQTNLGPARASTTVGFASGGVPLWVIVVTAILVCGFAVGAFLWYRSSGEGPGDDEGVPASTRSDRSQERSVPDLERSMATARRRLEAGHSEEALRATYTTMREALSEQTSILSDQPRTHWEFYRQCDRASLQPELLETVRRLTQLYERATYGGEPLSHEEVEDALSAADAGLSRFLDGQG